MLFKIKVIFSIIFFFLFFFISINLSYSIIDSDYTFLCLINILDNFYLNIERTLLLLFNRFQLFFSTVFVFFYFLYKAFRIKLFVEIFYKNLVINFGKVQYEELHSGSHELFLYGLFSQSGRKARKWSNVYSNTYPD